MLGKEVINDQPLTGEAAQMVREEAKKVLAERNKNGEKTIKERADDFVNDILSDVRMTNEQVEDVRTMSRIEAIKYLKTNVQGIDNIQHATIFYDTCIKHCL